MNRATLHTVVACNEIRFYSIKKVSWEALWHRQRAAIGGDSNQEKEKAIVLSWDLKTAFHLSYFVKEIHYNPGSQGGKHHLPAGFLERVFCLHLGFQCCLSESLLLSQRSEGSCHTTVTSTETLVTLWRTVRSKQLGVAVVIKTVMLLINVCNVCREEGHAFKDCIQRAGSSRSWVDRVASRAGVVKKRVVLLQRSLVERRPSLILKLWRWACKTLRGRESWRRHSLSSCWSKDHPKKVQMTATLVKP